MAEQREQSGSSNRGWLEKLGRTLSGGPQDYDSLVELLRDAERRGVIDQDAESMLEGVLQVTEMQVRDIMIPRAQMVVVARSQSLEELLPVVIESGCSRFPVIGEDRDEVVGILLAKDLLPLALRNNLTRESIREILRPATVVPESKRCNQLLKEFKENRNHMALVVDEYGGVAGLITIEDVLEQIVGDIEDEHDVDEDDQIMEREHGIYAVKAQTPIEDFNEFFGSDLDEEAFDTVGGLLLKEFGHLPRRGESATVEAFRFKVLNADNRKIRLVQVKPLA